MGEFFGWFVQMQHDIQEWLSQPPRNIELILVGWFAALIVVGAIRSAAHRIVSAIERTRKGPGSGW